MLVFYWLQYSIFNILIFVFVSQYKVCKIKHGGSERGMSGIGLGGLLLKSGISVYVSGVVAWPLDVWSGQLVTVIDYHIPC